MALGAADYVTLAAIRAEGITEAVMSDSRAESVAKAAARAVDAFCRCWFYDRTYGEGTELYLDGTGRDVLHLPAPIISIEQVACDYTGTRAFEEVQSSTYVAYDSDEDARNPKVVRISGDPNAVKVGTFDAVWPKGRRNVRLRCHLGWLEDDATPIAITRAVMRMVSHEKELIGSDYGTDARLERMGAVRSVTTHNRSVSYADVVVAGGLTGDPMVDGTLVRYRRSIL